MKVRVLKYDPQTLYNADGNAREHRGWNSNHRRNYLESEYAIIDVRRGVPRRVTAVLRLYGTQSRSSTTFACFWDHPKQVQGSARMTWGSPGQVAFRALSAAGMTFSTPEIPETRGRGLRDWDGDPEALMEALARHQGFRPDQYYIHIAHP